MSVARLLLTALAIGVAAPSANGETFDYMSVKATPSTYDGPCPVSIKLESLIRFDVIYNHKEKYSYRWEANDEALTDYETTFSNGRSNHIEGTAELSAPPGKSVTFPIRLHAVWELMFAKVHPYMGKVANDHYSSPFNVTVTCR